MFDLFFTATLVLTGATDPAGRYQVDGMGEACILRLQPSLPSLPQSFLTEEAQSGFAFATPGCPAGLEALSLWRFETESEMLTLVDESGEALLSATQQDGVWTGQTPGGHDLQLIRE